MVAELLVSPDDLQTNCNKWEINIGEICMSFFVPLVEALMMF